MDSNRRNVQSTRSVGSHSMLRKVQSVFRFGRSASLPLGAYTELNNLNDGSSVEDLAMLDSRLLEHHSDQQWHQTITANFLDHFQAIYGPKETKRQMAIHELFRSQANLCVDIRMMLYILRHIESSGKLTGVEAEGMFPTVIALYHTHRQLVDDLACIRNSDGVYGSNPGQVVHRWAVSVSTNTSSHEKYCFSVKHIIPALVKKVLADKDFVEFYKSDSVNKRVRRLDLKSFADQPRSHLMKYSLLLQAIRERTTDPVDLHALTLAETTIHQLILNIEQNVALREFRLRLAEIAFPVVDEQSYQVLHSCEEIQFEWRVQCRGCRDRFGVRPKCTLVLFDRALALLRPASRSMARGSVRCTSKCVASIKSTNDLYFDYGKPKMVKYESGLALLNKSRFHKRAKPKFSSSAKAQSTTLSRKLRHFKNSSRKPLDLIDSTEPISSNGNNDRTSFVNDTWGVVSRRPPQTVRLYSVMVKFDVTVKFRSADELQMFIGKMRNSFVMIRRTGSINSNNKNNKKTTLATTRTKYNSNGKVDSFWLTR